MYRNFDPRAKILQEACDSVFRTIKRKDPLLDIARKLEEIALKDPYFVDRKLFPNVDFYSGVLLRAIGIPTNMFTVCFAIGRLPGWIAQWKEQHEDPTSKNPPAAANLRRTAVDPICPASQTRRLKISAATAKGARVDRAVARSLSRPAAPGRAPVDAAVG